MEAVGAIEGYKVKLFWNTQGFHKNCIFRKHRKLLNWSYLGHLSHIGLLYSKPSRHFYTRLEAHLTPCIFSKLLIKINIQAVSGSSANILRYENMDNFNSNKPFRFR